jgi:hypothetical protein
MARCPQRVHSSRCPPSMAVRHRAMASSTLTCFQVIHLRLPSMNASPAARIGHLEGWPIHLLVLWWPVF